MAFDNAELARQLEDMREQQRAIRGVLRAVARNAGIQPVLDAVVEACERLCRADYGALYLFEHGLLHSRGYATPRNGDTALSGARTRTRDTGYRPLETRIDASPGAALLSLTATVKA